MWNGVFHSVFNRPPVKRYRDYFPIPRSSFTSSIMPKSQFMLARGSDGDISTVANFPVSQSFGIISKAISFQRNGFSSDDYCFYFLISFGIKAFLHSNQRSSPLKHPREFFLDKSTNQIYLEL